jgi:hypothetical protein
MSEKLNLCEDCCRIAQKAGLTNTTEVETYQLPLPVVLDSFTRVSS